MSGWWWVLVGVEIKVVGFVVAVGIGVRLSCGGGWQWLAMDVGVVVTGFAWTEKKVVSFIKERERYSGKIKIILFK